MFRRYLYNNRKSIVIIDDRTHLPVPEITDFLAHLKTHGSADFTAISYGSELLKWYRFCAGQNADPLHVFDKDSDTQALFDQFILSEAERGNCNSTINHALAAVYSYYNYLYVRKLIPSGPYQTFSTTFNRHNKNFLKGLASSYSESIGRDAYVRRDPANPVNFISWEQYKKMQEACIHPRDKVLIGIMFECGARIGEALGIRIEDINLEDNAIQLVYREDNPNNAYVKRHSERCIYLSDYLSGLLCELLISMTDLNPKFLFVVMYGKNKGRPMTYDNARDIVARAGRLAGLKVHPHMLRHGFAQVRLNDEKSPFTLDEIGKTMGHASDESTRIYAGLSEETIRRKSKEYLKERNLDEITDKEFDGKDGKTD
ncbi:tyrosine-type recombinase/integrase [Stecheria sp. CLA-KB-P133]|uniref:Tyrosine-type recombinase/integrase n=1 Tax=Grylomicrobium aquisgranensis TaxID=2926318 RepID=A0AB35U786_9FIRM|nr:tyrosine-type recombinase/integrase [Stecheria sp. CLA-KB-P133]